MKTAVTGATGFIGLQLVELLQRQEPEADVVLLVRDRPRAEKLFPRAFFPRVTAVGYTPEHLGAWVTALEGCDRLVNLAGEPIATQPWTKRRKRELQQSRVLTTQVLVEALREAKATPQVMVSGSAIGYYGTDPAKEFDDYSFAGDDFLAELCQQWEGAAAAVQELGTRLVLLRTGIVLGMGGVLARILPLFQAGVGGVLGSGRQWFSWIHRQDMTALIYYALTHPTVVGPLNGTAPQPVTNLEFTRALSRAVQRPAVVPVPAFALQILLGESSVLVLDGQKVLPKKALAQGFQFQYPEIDSALAQILAS
jgi:uncharacterized protein (TIGR01777 family)